jgi:hypothetical protein
LTHWVIEALGHHWFNDDPMIRCRNAAIDSQIIDHRSSITMPDPFADAIPGIAEEAQLEAAAVAVHDFASGGEWHVNGDRWFHAASTIKVAILVALAAAVDEGRFQLGSRLAVRTSRCGVRDRRRATRPRRHRCARSRTASFTSSGGRLREWPTR